jgi:hypothetical protein
VRIGAPRCRGRSRRGMTICLLPSKSRISKASARAEVVEV